MCSSPVVQSPLITAVLQQQLQIDDPGGGREAMMSCDPPPSMVFPLCHRVVHTLLPHPQVIPLSSSRLGQLVSEGDNQCTEKRARKGCVEGPREKGEGREGRPHLFMSISMGCLTASLSNSDFRMGVWAGRTGAADHVSR